MILSNIFLK